MLPLMQPELELHTSAAAETEVCVLEDPGHALGLSSRLIVDSSLDLNFQKSSTRKRKCMGKGLLWDEAGFELCWRQSQELWNSVLIVSEEIAAGGLEALNLLSTHVKGRWLHVQ